MLVERGFTQFVRVPNYEIWVFMANFIVFGKMKSFYVVKSVLTFPFNDSINCALKTILKNRPIDADNCNKYDDGININEILFRLATSR